MKSGLDIARSVLPRIILGIICLAVGMAERASALQITTATLPNGTEMVPYSGPLQATDGTLPYAWTLPFPFVFHGKTYTDIKIVSQGALEFDSSNRPWWWNADNGDPTNRTGFLRVVVMP